MKVFGLRIEPLWTHCWKALVPELDAAEQDEILLQNSQYQDPPLNEED